MPCRALSRRPEMRIFPSVRRNSCPCGHFPVPCKGFCVRATKFRFPSLKNRSVRAIFHPVRREIVPCDGFCFRATKNRFPHPEIRSVRAISCLVRRKSVPCDDLSTCATKFPSVRGICRSVRAYFRSVRRKSRLCDDFPICAGKNWVFNRFSEIPMIKKRQFDPVSRLRDDRNGFAVAERRLIIARSFNCWWPARINSSPTGAAETWRKLLPSLRDSI
jgi:hypothetical protein